VTGDVQELPFPDASFRTRSMPARFFSTCRNPCGVARGPPRRAARCRHRGGTPIGAARICSPPARPERSLHVRARPPPRLQPVRRPEPRGVAGRGRLRPVQRLGASDRLWHTGRDPGARRVSPPRCTARRNSSARGPLGAPSLAPSSPGIWCEAIGWAE
jgi:hypothetical protein